MDPQSPDVINQVPAGGGVSKPASGTYGEKAELERLRQSLPSSEPVQPVSSTSGPTGQVNPQPVSSVPPAGGIPAGLTAPTQRPNEPALPTMPTAPVDPYAGAADARQRQVVLLQALAKSPAVSPETREWAQILLEKMVGNESG